MLPHSHIAALKISMAARIAQRAAIFSFLDGSDSMICG
jgi:hypothetical protein